MIKNKKTRLVVLGLVLPISLVILFQNCSKLNFDSVPENLENKVLASIEGADAGSPFYTNNRIVYINLSVDTAMLDQLRLSTTSTMTETANPWQPVTSKVAFDLDTEYASNGSKDGPKTVYLEFRNSVSDKLASRVSKSVHVFLDTQAPEINGEDLLTKGVQGLEFKKSQNVEIKWNLADRVPSSGQASGLDPVANSRWAYTKSNDCSESSLFEKSSWGNLGTKAVVRWPTDDGLDVFYICLFAKDRAGNINTFLSQPMTSLWNVVAGDNSQGNGASVNSNKVRFKTPSFPSLLPNGDLAIRDADFFSWRRIKSAANDPSRLIEGFSFPLLGESQILFDRAGNAYFLNNKNVYTIKAADPTRAVTVVEVTGTIQGIAIRNYQNTERLVFGHYNNRVSDVTAEAFLFEVPLATLQSLTAPLAFSDLKAKHKIAGNGLIPDRSFPVPTGVTLSNSDPVDPKYATGYIAAITTGNSGEIYVNTRYFTGTTIGNLGIRRLTPKAGGTFLQEVLPEMTSAGRQISYIKQARKDGVVHEVLIASGSPPAATIFDFKTGKRLRPFTEVDNFDGGGVVIVPNETKTDYSFYITSITTSQIYHYDSSYKLIEVLGRPVHDNITDPLAAVIGNVDGLVTDNTENAIYFTDSQNALIRKIDDHGILSTVAGKPQVYISKLAYNDEPLSDFILDSSSFEEGYRYQLAADFNPSKNRKVLYVSAEKGQIHALDLAKAKVQTFLNPLASQVNGGDPKYWISDGMAFAKGPLDKNILLVAKAGRGTPEERGKGYIHMLPVQGTSMWGTDSVFMGNISTTTVSPAGSYLPNSSVSMVSQAKSVHVDSQGYVFVGAAPGLKVSMLNSTSPKTRILGPRMTYFAMVEEGTSRHFLYFSGPQLSLITLDTTAVFDLTRNPVSAVKTLCLPGTKVSQPGQFALDSAGNLLITDSANARILKYRIRDAAGNLKWTTTCPGV